MQFIIYYNGTKRINYGQRLEIDIAKRFYLRHKNVCNQRGINCAEQDRLTAEQELAMH